MFLLQMAGYPGSGKSTLAKNIAEKIDAIVIDRDVIKTTLIKAEVPEKLVAEASYKVVFDLVRFYQQIGKSVIIDTPCYYKDTLENGISISTEYGATYKYIECRVENYNIIEKRILSRERLVSQIGTTSLDSFNNSLDKSVKPSDGNFLVIDSSSEDSYDMDFIVQYLIELEN